MPLRVDIESVSLWEPMPRAGEVDDDRDDDRDDEREDQADNDKADGKEPSRQAYGVAIQSWGFRPPKTPREPSDPASYEIVVVEPESEQRLEEQRLAVVRPARAWAFEGTYVETREYRGPDGSPRPKHFFQATIPTELEERLRESPEDIMARSDLNEVRPLREDE